MTGISDNATELSTKRLGLLKELLPNLRKVAMLWNQDDLGMTLRYRSSAGAAESIGVAVQALGVREPNDFETCSSRTEGNASEVGDCIVERSATASIIRLPLER